MKTQELSRQKIVADKRTPAQKIAIALQSGPIKSELRTAQEAIVLARVLASQAERYMSDPKLHFNYAEDCVVRIAYMTPDLSVLHTSLYVAGQEAAIQAELSGRCCIMVGLIFGIRDPQKGGWYFGGRKFLDTPLVRMALKQQLEEGATQDYGA